MGQITSLFVHKVIRQVDEALDKRALLRSVGVDPDLPVDPSVMVGDTDYYALLEIIARADSRAIDLPLRVGASMRCDDYGAFGLAWKSAPDLAMPGATDSIRAFVPVPHDAFVAEVAASGAPEDVVWMLDYLFATVLDGRNAYLMDGVQRALGRAPRDFGEYASAVAAAGLWKAAA